jgi:Xaa-Pro aminopeptidase
MTGTGITAEAFARRRRRVLEALGDRSAMVLPAAPELVAGRDLEIRYVPDADLWYLTGYGEPEAVAVLRPDADQPFTLFVRPRDPEREVWTGARGGVETARADFGADAAFPLSELADRLPRLLDGADRVCYPARSGRDDVDRILLDQLARGRRARQRTGRGLSTLADPGMILDDMRLLKEPEEVDAIRAAVDVTVEAFRNGLAAAHPGAGEWEVEAAVEFTMRRAGAQGPAFATIAASGPNATILHYVANNRRIQPHDLLLLDAGARVHAYNGDLTRTAPVSGRFSPPQRDVYQAVLQAHDAAIAAATPGASTRDVHHAALHVLVRAMVDLRLLRGNPDTLIDHDDAWKPWYPHSTSHWLGLDVHDVGTYALLDQPRPLVPGMVLTIEPGLYIPTGADAPPLLQGIGVRIEDDILVTDNGPEILSRALPTAPDQVEELVRR